MDGVGEAEEEEAASEINEGMGEAEEGEEDDEEEEEEEAGQQDEVSEELAVFLAKTVMRRREEEAKGREAVAAVDLLEEAGAVLRWTYGSSAILLCKTWR